MISLFLRSLFWAILCPGTVTLFIPCFFFVSREQISHVWQRQQWLGFALGLLGASILVWCIYAFARDGKGTLSPADPARRLVLRGMYRYVRNPMYVGVVTVLLAEAIFFASLPLLGYAAVVFFGFNLFIHFHEEPYLRKHFGAEYVDYCKKVGRWLPRF
jgi:protein-S-isoprenylcysteine O-methyltransferase Ste14